MAAGNHDLVVYPVTQKETMLTSDLIVHIAVVIILTFVSSPLHSPCHSKEEHSADTIRGFKSFLSSSISAFFHKECLGYLKYSIQHWKRPM